MAARPLLSGGAGCCHRHPRAGLFTWSLARQTRKLATESEEDVRAEFRPVIVSRPGQELTCHFEYGQPVRTLFDITNVGRGPALNVKAVMLAESSSDRASPDLVSPGIIEVGGNRQLEAVGTLNRDRAADENEQGGSAEADLHHHRRVRGSGPPAAPNRPHVR